MNAPAPRSASPGSVRVLLPLTLLSCVLAGWQLLGRDPGPLRDPAARPRPVAPSGGLRDQEQAVIDLFRRTSPSVVNVTNLAVRRDWFRKNLHEIPQGAGSGFVWDDAGHIVTNFHVVRGGQAFQVTLSDETTWNARLVGFDVANDLAVLKADGPASRLPAIEVGRSDGLQVGQMVFAIGNPFGLDQTLTTGIISGLGREFYSLTNQPITGAIQTDAAINPGNSGGPLLDSSGRLIGVNTAILSPSGAYSGVGFAVPVDVVNRVVPRIISGLGRIGLGVRPADDEVSRRLGLEGVLVLDVLPGYGAAEAGLRGVDLDRAGQLRQMGDVIVAVDGRPIRRLDDLYAALDDHEAGDSVRVSILRKGARQTVRVQLRQLD